MKKPVKIILIIVAVLFVLNILKNGIIQFALGSGISAGAHVSASIGSTNAHLLGGNIRLKNFRLKNPWGFSGPAMVDAPLIFIDFDLGSIGKQKLHFREIEVHLKQVTIIKNAKGEVNVNALKSKEAKAGKSESSKKAKAPKMHIDRMTLSVDRVVYQDYSGGGKPAIQVFDVNIQKRVFTNIEDPTAMVSVIMLESLANTTISRLANLDLGFLTDNAEGIFNDVLGGGVDTLEKNAKNLFGMFK